MATGARDPAQARRARMLRRSLHRHPILSIAEDPRLIRREDPGRDPSNPFCQATAITEVRLPREFITELARSPNRPLRDPNPAETLAVPAADRREAAGSVASAATPDTQPPTSRLRGSATEPPRNARSVG